MVQRIGWTRPGVLLLAGIFLLALLLRVGAAVMFPNSAHPDEIFQTREPAHRLAYAYGVITWEYRDGVRSWVFPAFLAGVMRATDWMGPASAGYLLGIVVVLSMISLTTVWFGFMWAYRASGAVAAAIAAGACAMWFELVYYAPKALNEVVAAHLLLPGLYLGTYGEFRRERTRLFVAGLFYGLALALRPPLIPAVALAVVWQSRGSWSERLPVLVAGILVPLGLFGLVDALTWSYPFQSFVRYFWVNIVQGKNVIFGVQPWYWYLLRLGLRLGPMVLLALMGARRSPFLGVVALAILASHSIIPHKEDRFIYPLLPIALTLSAVGLADAVAWLSTRLPRLRSATTAATVSLVFLASISVLFASRFHPWSRDAGNLMAMEALSRDRAVCGVGLRGISWSHSGGYTYLHRNVPILVIYSEADEEKFAPALSAILTDHPMRDPRFTLVSCLQGTCVYRRAGSCRPPDPGDEINEFLKRKGA